MSEGTDKTFTKEQMMVFINEVIAACEADNAHLPSAPKEHREGYLLFKSIKEYIQTH